MFKLKEKKIKHMKDVFEIEATNIALMVEKKIGSGFEHLCEIDNLHNDVHNLNLTIKELETENRFKEEQLIKLGLIDNDEHEQVSKVLSAAAMTYVAGLISNLLQLLRLVILLSGRDD